MFWYNIFTAAYRLQEDSITSFFYWAIEGLFLLIFIFSIQLTINKIYLEWLDSKSRPLVQESTTQPMICLLTLLQNFYPIIDCFLVSG